MKVLLKAIIKTISWNICSLPSHLLMKKDSACLLSVRHQMQYSAAAWHFHMHTLDQTEETSTGSPGERFRGFLTATPLAEILKNHRNFLQ